MARDQRRQQKKLARKSRKQKAKAKQRKRRSSAIYGAAQLSQASIYDAIAPDEIFEGGIGNVMLSRNLGHGFFAISVFLVDVYCLGVKDAFFARVKDTDYAKLKKRYCGTMPTRDVEPTYIRKLVEGAVAYARELGFEPHNDYMKAYKIFYDIDPDECTTEFEYGHNGKPFFISGPHDSPVKCKRIMDTLAERVGPDGFEFMLGEPGFDISG